MSETKEKNIRKLLFYQMINYLKIYNIRLLLLFIINYMRKSLKYSTVSIEQFHHFEKCFERFIFHIDENVQNKYK